MPGTFTPKEICFAFMSKWALAKFPHPLHKAAAGCGATGAACCVPQACLSKGKAVLFQDSTDEMMPSLRTRLHFALRDAATECEEPVAAKAPRCGEQWLTGVTAAQQSTWWLMQRVGARKTPCVSKQPPRKASRKPKAESLWAVNALLQVAAESFSPAKSLPLKPHLKIRLVATKKFLNL